MDSALPTSSPNCASSSTFMSSSIAASSLASDLSPAPPFLLFLLGSTILRGQFSQSLRAGDKDNLSSCAQHYVVIGEGAKLALLEQDLCLACNVNGGKH